MVVLIIIGGLLMARLLNSSAERSDVWDRYGWPNDKERPGRERNHDA